MTGSDTCVGAIRSVMTMDAVGSWASSSVPPPPCARFSAARSRGICAQWLVDPVERDHALVDLPEQSRLHRLHAVERAVHEVWRRPCDAFHKDAAHVLGV